MSAELATGAALSIISIGVGLLGLKRPNLRLSRLCFTVADIIILAEIEWALKFEISSFKLKGILFSLIPLGIIGTLWVLTMKWVKRQKIEPVVPPIIIQAPLVGNIKQRAIALSDEIMEDLYRHGWPQGLFAQQKTQPTSITTKMPITPEGAFEWAGRRSAKFKYRFLERVRDLRNEFSQLHIRDERLDDFFKYRGMEEDANRQLTAAGLPRQINSTILPQQIEQIATTLRILAEQVK